MVSGHKSDNHFLTGWCKQERLSKVCSREPNPLFKASDLLKAKAEGEMFMTNLWTQLQAERLNCRLFTLYSENESDFLLCITTVRVTLKTLCVWWVCVHQSTLTRVTARKCSPYASKNTLIDENRFGEPLEADSILDPQQIRTYKLLVLVFFIQWMRMGKLMWAELYYYVTTFYWSDLKFCWRRFEAGIRRWN